MAIGRMAYTCGHVHDMVLEERRQHLWHVYCWYAPQVIAHGQADMRPALAGSRRMPTRSVGSGSLFVWWSRFWWPVPQR